MTVVLLAAAAVWGIWYFANAAFTRLERRECLEWQHDAIYNSAELRGWQSWQKEQCEAHRIIVEWPEK